MGKAVGAEGLVAGQIVDIKSEGMAEQVRCWSLALSLPCLMPNPDSAAGSVHLLCACIAVSSHEPDAVCTVSMV